RGRAPRASQRRPPAAALRSAGRRRRGRKGQAHPRGFHHEQPQHGGFPVRLDRRDREGARGMQEFPINWAAIVVAALAKMVLGAVWYSPVAFGPAWMELVGRTPEETKAAMPKGMAV